MQPLSIGPLSILPPLVAAPLAGYSDLPFRLLCREYGAGLCYSEMLSCHGLVRRQPATLEMLATTAAERPLIMQLFGAEPEVMGEAAAILGQLPIDGLDINMGCPVKKVVKKGAGAALMRTPERAAAITGAVVAAAGDLPVTVKIRSGWHHGQLNAPDFARLMVEHGAAAVTIHARTWSDGFAGTADWEVIAAVKQAVPVPVLGNGDIHSYQQALAMMATTGCDGVMIGRGALGAPWVFSASAEQHPALTPRLAAARRHLELIRHWRPADNPARVRNQLGRYFKNIPGGARLRRQIYDHNGSINQLAQLLASLG
ncbi:MAG: tRNA dihydrouridine synthase DusB [Desulfurivibrio sp.]|nr:tRNA dihydrouridine synthase DusB [Desulfurivibrio sp.]